MLYTTVVKILKKSKKKTMWKMGSFWAIVLSMWEGGAFVPPPNFKKCTFGGWG